ncbi:hypothetical protein [Gemmata sp.]|uniref:hypothetical protein n=1 Tax=Gemmata sp. TaxID=1914242 RepID=UPI003F71BBF4
MDFSQEELVEAVERLVNGLLERAGVAAPPVDALRVAEEHLGIPVEVIEPAEEDEHGRRRPRARQQTQGVQITDDMTDEQKNKAAAAGIARSLLPEVLKKLGVPLGAEDRSLRTHIASLVVPRVLIPTRLLRAALRDCKYDVPALKTVFATATTEAVALRLLDLDEPCVIAIVDDAVVALRRSNRFAVPKALEAAERACLAKVAELELPHRVRLDGWTTTGWHVPDRPFQRIILRSVRDDDV